MATKAQLVARIGAGAFALVVACAVHFEGTVYRSYQDPVGIWTACNGHTGPDVKANQRYTPEQCEALLVTDLFKHDVDIGKCVELDELTDGQRAAFLSFAFNVGATKFCQSTMARLVRAGRVLEACKEFPRWVYAGGRVLNGLVKRRAHEQAMCEGRV